MGIFIDVGGNTHSDEKSVDETFYLYPVSALLHSASHAKGSMLSYLMIRIKAMCTVPFLPQRVEA